MKVSLYGVIVLNWYSYSSAVHLQLLGALFVLVLENDVPFLGLTLFFIFLCVVIISFFYFKTNIVINSCAHRRHIYTSNAQVYTEVCFAHAASH